jgi:hypothetical protein
VRLRGASGSYRWSREIVVGIDDAAGLIRVRLPEGLFEL